MTIYRGYWVSAFQDDQDVRFRYHPQVGCGEYYAGGIDQAEMETLAPGVFDQLAQRSGCSLSFIKIGFCQYDGWVAEAYMEPGWMSREDISTLLDEIQSELGDLHIQYVDLGLDT